MTVVNGRRALVVDTQAPEHRWVVICYPAEYIVLEENVCKRTMTCRATSRIREYDPNVFAHPRESTIHHLRIASPRLTLTL